MIDTFQLFNIQKSVAISVLLHGAVFLTLAYKFTHHEIVPIGVEVHYFAGAPAAPSAAPSKVAKSQVRKAERVADAAKVHEVNEPVAANETSSSISGPVGKAEGAVVSAIERYKYELRLFLESRKIYPESAKRLHQTGTVIVQFKVTPDGQLLDVNLSQASNSEVLNRAALDLVKRASTFKPFPKEVQMQELQLLLPIEYVL